MGKGGTHICESEGRSATMKGKGGSLGNRATFASLHENSDLAGPSKDCGTVAQFMGCCLDALLLGGIKDQVQRSD